MTGGAARVENHRVAEVDLETAVPALVGGVEAVTRVELRGWRQRGEANKFSDWDFVVHTDDFERTAVGLPAAVKVLAPLAVQWDRLSDEPCFMFLFSGPVKIDLIFDGLTHEWEPPWTVDGSTLAFIDAHFWDWTLWLASKLAAGKRAVVDAELDRMHVHLLGPMGATRPVSVAEAVSDYLDARSSWGLGLELDHSLGDAVAPVVQHATAVAVIQASEGDLVSAEGEPQPGPPNRTCP